MKRMVAVWDWVVQGVVVIVVVIMAILVGILLRWRGDVVSENCSDDPYLIALLSEEKGSA